MTCQEMARKLNFRLYQTLGTQVVSVFRQFILVEDGKVVFGFNFLTVKNNSRDNYTPIN
jgi:hypothetical protein